jgi:CheY-like chemotaxis protein
MTPSNIRILFVDDEPLILRAVQRTLAGTDYVLAFTTSPEEVAELVGEQRVDIVVSDQNMPGMTGVELLRLLERFHHGLYRIILSGDGDPTPMMRGLEDGALHAYLAKPWHPNELRAVLAVAADAVRARRGQAPEPDLERAAQAFAVRPRDRAVALAGRTAA